MEKEKQICRKAQVAITGKEWGKNSEPWKNKN